MEGYLAPKKEAMQKHSKVIIGGCHYFYFLTIRLNKTIFYKVVNLQPIQELSLFVSIFHQAIQEY